MPRYLLYHMNPASGHIDRVEDVVAADDVAAIYDIQHRRTTYPLELWRDGRKIGRVDRLPESAHTGPLAI